jgi:xylulokinase
MSSGIHPKVPLVLAVDVGTTAMKGGLITQDGELVSYHRVTYWEKTKQDYHSWNPQVWVDSLRDIVASLGGYQQIIAVVISGHGPSLVPVDRDGKNLFSALLWLDQRQNSLSGTMSFFLPKIAWFKENHPGLYEKTQWFLSCPEYLDYFLCGEAHTVTPSDEFEPYIWYEKDWKHYSLDPGKLPPFVKTGDIIGKVRQEASYFTGIPVGIPVVAGGSDFLLSLLGSGAVEPGRTCDRAGTSEGINFCHTHKVEHPHLRVLPHTIEGLYNISGILSSTGRLFEWMRRITGQDRISYREILQNIDTLPMDRSRPLFFPSFDQRGDFEFAHGGFMRLSPEHSQEDLGRSVVESIGFGIKNVLEHLESAGCEVKEMRVTGGQAKNVIWNQMKADMTGRRILVPEIEDAELLGGAVCAWTALKNFPSLQEASQSLVRIRAVYNPRMERAKLYDDLYTDYSSCWEKVGEI